MGLGYKARPEVGALEEGLYDLDVLLLRNRQKLESGPKRGEIVGALKRQQVDRTWR